MEFASQIIARLGLEALDKKYSVSERPKGQGSYGSVYAGRDNATQQRVAIKILEGFPHDTLDSKRLLREITALRLLKGHAHIIRLEHITASAFGNTDRLRGIALIFKYHDTDLSKVIASRQLLGLEHYQFMLHQLISGMHCIHSANFVHRDLKPSNILLDEDVTLTICDFGLARATHAKVTQEVGQVAVTTPLPLYRKLTQYVVTRWYRCPELVIGNSNAGEAPADMWSIGCILAELLLRKPLFAGAEDNASLMALILDLLGTLEEEDYAWIESERIKNKIKQYPVRQPQIDRIFKGADCFAIDLLKQLLHFNPSKRLTAEQALQHPFLASYTHEAPLTFSMESMSEEDKADLSTYYRLEKDLDDGAESPELTQRIHALIKQQVAYYAPRVEPPILPLVSPSNTPGTVFHPNQETSTVITQQVLEPPIPGNDASHESSSTLGASQTSADSTASYIGQCLLC